MPSLIPRTSMPSICPSFLFRTRASSLLAIHRSCAPLLLPICASLLVLICARPAVSQSGRRPKAPPPSTPPSNQISENDSPIPERKKISILVGRQPTSKRLLSEDTIYAAFVKRLNEQKSVEAIAIGDVTKRDEAVKQARAESNRFVVLLKLEIDSFQQGTIVLNSPDLQVKYFVYAPRTGAQKYKGKVYFQAIGGARARKDAWPNGPPIKITPEAAGFAAADGLYDWLLLNAGIRER